MGSYRDKDDFLDEDWAGRGGDDDDPDDWDDASPDEDDELTDCPQCGLMIHVESERCPQCGHYLTDEGPEASVWHGRSWWWLALGGLGIAAVIYALSRPFGQ
jgi:hypothetical protein